MIQVGDKAPDFELPVLIGGVRQRFRLSEHKGKTLVLAFYPSNWNPASSGQFTEYQVQREKLLECNAEVIGISVDSIMNTTAWEREIGPFDFPLCSDFWPHGDVCARYGVLRTGEPASGTSERAIFIVDQEGTVVFCQLYGLEVVPNLQQLFGFLRSLRAA